MDRPSALAYLNGRMLAAYSSRTTSELRAALPLRLALPHVEPLIELNVQKEIQKDSLVIRHAGQYGAASPEGQLVRALFMQTKRIDNDFVARVGTFPLRIVIPYAEIEPLRVERIKRLLSASGRILAAWGEEARLRGALRDAFTQAELESTLREILDLYARETHALTRSVRLPLLLEPLRERIAQHLLAIMRGAGARLAVNVARGVYRDRASF
jgi:hypothetical protein